VPELPPHDAQPSFSSWFSGAFSPRSPGRSTRWRCFLDDLANGSTIRNELDLLEDLVDPAGVPASDVVGAYRVNEVNSAHPLIRKVEASPQGGRGSARKLSWRHSRVET